ncbi:MAG TPA: hypothetical protein VHC20_07225 [Candidatus Paceibacterota bacterium]|nr:hypothetical protein [Candidatus Paceibacterota bacterium]
MSKFFVTFSMPAATVQKWMETVDEATRKEQTENMMQEWNDWMTAHASQIVDKGLPLGKTKRVDASGVSDTKNELNWYLIVEADSHDAAAQLFVDHPHIKMIPDTYVEVMTTAGPANS